MTHVIFPIPWDAEGLAITAACGRLVSALPRRGAAGGGQSAAGRDSAGLRVFDGLIDG